MSQPISKSRTPEYAAWQHAKRRCNAPQPKDAPYYRDRGIKVAPEWMQNFPAFLAHVGLRPTQNHSLDRIDNEGDYQPGNVRWATPQQQARNRRFCHRVLFREQVVTVAELLPVSQAPMQTLYRRIRAGIPVERAILRDSMVRKDATMLSFNGRVQPLAVWAKELQMRTKTVRERLRRGMPVEQALTQPLRSIAPRTKPQRRL